MIELQINFIVGFAEIIIFSKIVAVLQRFFLFKLLRSHCTPVFTFKTGSQWDFKYCVHEQESNRWRNSLTEVQTT